jgi:hypothetical protein
VDFFHPYKKKLTEWYVLWWWLKLHKYSMSLPQLLIVSSSLVVLFSMTLGTTDYNTHTHTCTHTTLYHSTRFV